MTDDVGAILQSGFIAQSQGRFQEAENACRRVLRKHPTHAGAILLSGIVASRTGRLKLATAHLGKAVSASPNDGAAHHWLSVTLRQLGDFRTATLEAEAAARLLPEDPEVLYNLGLCLLAVRRNQEAADALEGAVERNKEHGLYLQAYAGALDASGRSWEALRTLERAATIDPDANILVGLSHLHLTLGDSKRAAGRAREALELDGRNVGAHLLLALALGEMGELEAARRHEDAAKEIDPVGSGAFEMTRANHLQFQGRLEEAHAAFERVIEANPRKGSAHFGWIASGGDDALEDGLARMEAALRLGGMIPAEESTLQFAYGRALERSGRFEAAMGAYDEANRLAGENRMGKFDLAALRTQVDQIIDRSPVAPIDRDGGTEEGFAPLFIVGVMRSGTSLAEQILSCHSLIGGAGEHGFWTRKGARLGWEASKERRAEMGREYAAMLRDIAPGSAIIIDKNPANFYALGLIVAALPTARILHMRRNPADTCLSIHSTPMQNRPSFAFSKRGIVDAYGEYLRLMSHWRSTLPAERFLEVDYEAMVSEREKTVGRMLAFCGVEFEDACLHPETNARRVATPSFWQVRKPIHTGSTGRWKRFEPWLGEFEELL